MSLEKLPYKYILILFYLASTYFIIYHDYGYTLFITSLVIKILLILSHYQIVYTEPGPIKLQQTPIEIMEEIQKKQVFTPHLIIENQLQLQNKCKKCHGYWKPPKAHHCSTCNKCIYYRDHHCIWFNCCIGYKNLKFFCQFLIYFAIITIIHGITSLFQFFQLIKQIHLLGINNLSWSFLYNFLSFDFIFNLFQLLISYIGYQISNQLLKDKFIQLPDLDTYHGQKGQRYTYFRNFDQKLKKLLGNNLLLWILPLPNKFNLNYLELIYPKVTAGIDLLDYYLDKKSENYYHFYKIFEIND